MKQWIREYFDQNWDSPKSRRRPRLELVKSTSPRKNKVIVQFPKPAPVRVAPVRLWTRSILMLESNPLCVHCSGVGTVSDHQSVTPQPCSCVLRSIFRRCAREYKACHRECYLYRRNLINVRREEFRADFSIIARRVLSPEDYQIFKRHVLLKQDWRACGAALDISRGNFFHRVYAIQLRLGRAFYETYPFALYPIHEYFHSRRPTTANAVRLQPQPSEEYIAAAA